MVGYENKELGVKEKERESIWECLEEVFEHLFSLPQAAHLTTGGEVNQLKVPKGVSKYKF